MKFERELLKGIAPIVTLQILSRGKMYGYQLIEAMAEQSGDILNLGQGTIYPLLYNLEARKLIEGKWETAESGRKRKYYSITSKGKEKLDADKLQLGDLFKGLKLVFGNTVIEA